MSKRTTRAASAERQHSRRQAPVSSTAADNADHALANIRAWTQLLVARGNRLLELAVRERAAAAGAQEGRPQATSRKRGDAAPAASRRTGEPVLVAKEHAGLSARRTSPTGKAARAGHRAMR